MAVITKNHTNGCYSSTVKIEIYNKSRLPTMQQMQPIYMNGGGDPLITAKRSPTQIYPTQQMQLIGMKGHGDTVISAQGHPQCRLFPCLKQNKYLTKSSKCATFYTNEWFPTTIHGFAA